jgi:hypothetical protein
MIFKWREWWLHRFLLRVGWWTSLRLTILTSAVYALLVVGYALFSGLEDLNQVNNVVLGSISTVLSAWVGLALCVDIWKKTTGKQIVFPYYQVLYTLCFVVMWPGLWGLVTFHIVLAGLTALIFGVGIIAWLAGMLWILSLKLRGNPVPSIPKKDLSIITHTRQDDNETEAQDRGWWTGQQKLENRPGAADDPKQELSVVVSGPQFTFDPFPSRDLAVTFLRRWVRDSIELLRKPGQSGDELFDLWFALGETGAVVGDEYSVLREIDEFIDKTATDEDRDWRTIKAELKITSHAEWAEKEDQRETVKVMTYGNDEGQGEEQWVDGFPTLKLAMEFVERYVVDSVEELKEPIDFPETWFMRWEKSGRSAQIAGCFSGRGVAEDAINNRDPGRSRDWRSIKELISNRRLFEYDGNSPYSVVVWDVSKLKNLGENSPRFIGFPSLELAREFARRFTMDSAENLRKANDSGPTLLKRWMTDGQCAIVENGDYSGYEYLTLHTDMGRPATPAERDWKAIEMALHATIQPALKTHRKFPVDVSLGLQMEKPNILIPWECSEKTLECLLEPYGPERAHSGFTLPCVLWGGVKQIIGFQFGKDGQSGNYEGRGFWAVHFIMESPGEFVEDYWTFQKGMEAAFGQPELESGPDPSVYDLPGFRWRLRHVSIDHWVMERFGPEEHRDFSKTYDVKDDSLIMELVNGLLKDESLSDQPVFTLITGTPCAGKTTHIRENLLEDNVWIDAGEIFLKLNQGSWSGFGKTMKYPMGHIGRRVLRRALCERRNIVMELWPQTPETLQSFFDPLRELGFKIKVIDMDCELETAQRRNDQRESNNISSHFSSPFHLDWLEVELKSFSENDTTCGGRSEP